MNIPETALIKNRARQAAILADNIETTERKIAELKMDLADEETTLAALVQVRGHRSRMASRGIES